MNKMVLLRKVGSKEKNCWFKKEAKYDDIPPIGAEIIVDGHHFNVIAWTMNYDTGVTFVDLRADFSAYKSGDFDKNCAKMIKYGFVKLLNPEKFKKKTIRQIQEEWYDLSE